MGTRAEPMDDFEPRLERWRPGAGLLVIAMLVVFLLLVVVGLLTGGS